MLLEISLSSIITFHIALAFVVIAIVVFFGLRFIDLAKYNKKNTERLNILDRDLMTLKEEVREERQEFLHQLAIFKLEFREHKNKDNH